jgi:hypothetical protein
MFCEMKKRRGLKQFSYLISIFFDEAADAETKLAVPANTPVHSVDEPGGLVGVNSCARRVLRIHVHLWATCHFNSQLRKIENRTIHTTRSVSMR